jgi:hypothetical protein
MEAVHGYYASAMLLNDARVVQLMIPFFRITKVGSSVETAVLPLLVMSSRSAGLFEFVVASIAAQSGEGVSNTAPSVADKVGICTVSSTDP